LLPFGFSGAKLKTSKRGHEFRSLCGSEMVIRQDDDGLDVERMAPPNIAERLAQEVDVIDEKTQAALSQIGREEKAAAADEVSPIVRHRASIARLKVMGFAEPVIGPVTSGLIRWLNPSYGLKCCRRSDGFHFVQPILRAEFYKLVGSISSALISHKGKSLVVHDQGNPFRWSLTER
jgi:hypothetical protein